MSLFYRGLLWLLFGWGRVYAAVLRWHYACRPPPPVKIPGCNPLGNDHGEHNTQFVSRHDIAECGLVCPNCRSLAADRGDFQAVVDSQYGEAVKCEGCGLWLIASPNTEHGDDLLPYNERLFHRFVRITPKKATQERYGEDIDTDLTAHSRRFRLGGEAARLVMDDFARSENQNQRLFRDPSMESTAILPAIKE